MKSVASTVARSFQRKKRCEVHDESCLPDCELGVNTVLGRTRLLVMKQMHCVVRPFLCRLATFSFTEGARAQQGVVRGEGRADDVNDSHETMKYLDLHTAFLIP